MNTLAIEAELAEKYGYKPLSAELSRKYRDFFKKNIPGWLKLEGSDNTPLYTMNGSKICNGYSRIVIGDYGAFIEFDASKALDTEMIVKPGQEYRIDNPKYNKNVKYYWLTINDGSEVKIYEQRRSVAYADYVPGMYYVSVHEVKQIEH